MNYLEAIEFILNYKPTSNVPCSYCQATKYENAPEIIEAISRCGNCRVDIEFKGGWSGHGIEALQKAMKLMPINSKWPDILEILGLVKTDPAETP